MDNSVKNSLAINAQLARQMSGTSAPDGEQQNALAANYARNAAYANPNQAPSQPGAYMTPLDPIQEIAFRQWLASTRARFDPNAQISDYDMRGFYQALQNGDPRARTGINPIDNQLHYTDTFKTPYHRSFSNESQYATPMAPEWNDNHQLIQPMNGAVVFDERKRR